MKISVTKEKTENKQRTKAKKIVLCITFMLGVMFFIFTQWSNFTYGHVAADQMIINLTSPTQGTDSGIYIRHILLNQVLLKKTMSIQKKQN